MSDLKLQKIFNSDQVLVCLLENKRKILVETCPKLTVDSNENISVKMFSNEDELKLKSIDRQIDERIDQLNAK